ncbi:MAG: tRNA (adenosine(37)-N6)-threonylcarbamoyltransferase complex dimerization subunit type 1 TsaB [Ornithinimicrobium sp.]
MLLAIDTSTSLIGAACVQGSEVLSEVTVADARRHGELLAPTIQRALREADCGVGELDRILVGVGPGPFTGLRVGISTGLVMAHALGIPVQGVCSLDALAAQAMRTVAAEHQWPEFLVATDARRKEVYWARYAVHQHGVTRIGQPAVARPGDLSVDIRSLPAVGRGPVLYPDVLNDSSGPLDVSPGTLGLLGTVESLLLPPEPLYLRRPDAVPSAAAPSFTAATP